MDKNNLTRRDSPDLIEAEAVPLERPRRAARKREEEITSFSPWVWLLILALGSFKFALGVIVFVLVVFRYPKLLLGGLGKIFGGAKRAVREYTADDSSPRRKG